MSTYPVINITPLVFEPKVNTAGQLTIELQTAPGNYILPVDDVVLDDILAALGPVVLHVLDNVNHTMAVYPKGSGTAWYHADGVSQLTVDIPAVEDEVEEIEILIKAKDPTTGAVVAQRSQTVIIKHRPSGD